MSENPNDAVQRDDHDSETQSIPVAFDRVLETLEKGAFAEEYGILRWSSNYAFLVAVAHDDLTVTAVYKPQKGERPLWDFPDGTLCYREYASFLTSQVLGWEIVPPTALREGSRGLGSVQFYIDHDPEMNYFAFDETKVPQLMRMAVFDYLINNTDRKGGHCLVDAQGHVWGIDHGITFHTANKLRTVIWDYAGQDIPDAFLTDVERLAEQMDGSTSFRHGLSRLLSSAEINAFETRIRYILRERRYPLPGPGPNYPWPPV